jgi:hypothetical protein
MEYVKQITGRFKNDNREEGLKIIAKFWNAKVGKVKGLTAFVLMANLHDSHGQQIPRSGKQRKTWMHTIVTI